MHSLACERDRFVAFAFAAAEVFLELQNDGRIAYATGAVSRMFATAADAVVGTDFGGLVDQHDRPLFDLLLKEVRQGGRRGPVSLTLAADGKAVEASVFRMPQSATVHLALRAGSKRRSRSNDETSGGPGGLLAPMSFAELAEQELLRILSADDQLQLSLVRIVGLENVDGGLDGERVRDVLQNLAAALRAVSVSGDSAARLGPEQFALLRSDDDDGRLDELVADALAGEGLDEVRVERQDIELGSSAMSADQACAAMRFALKAFESDGSASFDHLADALTRKLSDTASRVEAAKSMIDARNFFVVYQPVVALDSRKTHHFEALTRLRSNETPIFEFVTFAEEIGFIVDFDLAVAREALNKIATLRRQRRHPHVAVNVSARSLQCDGFVDQILQLCKSMSDPRQLLFEVTESFQLVDLQRANAVIQEFRKRGHSVCLDDFGAGAAGFHYIRALQVDYVKLDGAFVQQIAHDERDAAVIHAMVDVCNSLQVAMIAEMIETPATADALKALGVQYGQGFLFGRAGADPLVQSN